MLHPHPQHSTPAAPSPSLRSSRTCPNRGLFSFQGSDCAAHPSLGDCPRSAARGDAGRLWPCRSGDTSAVQALPWQTLAPFLVPEAFAWRQAAPAPRALQGSQHPDLAGIKLAPFPFGLKAAPLRLRDVKWQRSLFCLDRGGESPASQPGDNDIDFLDLSAWPNLYF